MDSQNMIKTYEQALELYKNKYTEYYENVLYIHCISRYEIYLIKWILTNDEKYLHMVQALDKILYSILNMSDPIKYPVKRAIVTFEIE